MSLVIDKHSDARVVTIPMSEVFADQEFNCRGHIIPLDVTDLAKAIQEQGLIQPIIVQPYTSGPAGTKWRIVAGYRRHFAHVINKATHIDCIIRENLTASDARILNLSENLNRADLSLVQTAKALQTLINQGLTQQEVADRLNVSRTWVQVRVYVLRMVPEVQAEIEAGFIKIEHVNAMKQMDREEQLTFTKKIKEIKQSEGKRARVAVSVKKLKKSVHDTMKRDPSQIAKMMEHIIDEVGGNFGTRCLAWCLGNISTHELSKDIKKIADDQGEFYSVLTQDLG